MGIEVKHINKKYKDTIILDDVNLSVKTGELVALLGPSGSGKTSLLRIIAGLETADSGKVLLEGENTEFKSIQERKVGFVFQHYALFKHMTVFENMAFGLRVIPRRYRPSSKDIKKKIAKLIELMHLEGYEDHYPSQLSGGQQQRVALVRALAVDPKVLLLDEPFGALDAKVRKELCRFIRMLHDEIKVSSIFVTHDQEEAMAVADRVCIMNEGKVQQIDKPEDLWQNPANLFVFTFLGSHNSFEGWVDLENNIHLTKPQHSQTPTEKFYTRPYELQISRSADENKYLSAEIVHINSTGSLVKVELVDHTNQFILVEIDHQQYNALDLKPGERVFIIPQKLHRFI